MNSFHFLEDREKLNFLLGEVKKQAKITHGEDYHLDFLIGFFQNQKMALPKPAGYRAKISKTKRLRIFQRDGEKCLMCNRADDLTLDHIVPVVRGGGDDESNLRTLCRSCNSKKGAS